jgi:hypothetical protein
MQTTTIVAEEGRVVAARSPAVDSGVSAVSWAAIIGGAFAMAGISLILLALGSGLGFASISPWSNAGPSATTFGIAAAIWLIVVQWLSAAFGGYLTGRLRTKWVSLHSDEIYFRDTAHGFLAWAVAAVFTIAALGSAAGSLVGGAAQIAATAPAAQTAGANGAAPSSGTALGPEAYLVNELFRRDHPDGSGDPQSIRAEAGPIIVHGLSEGGMPPPDKAYLAQLVSARTGLAQPDAAERVGAVDAQVKAVWSKARETADQARKAASYLSLFTAFSMLIGAFIAAVAASVGGYRRDEVLAMRAGRPLPHRA